MCVCLLQVYVLAPPSEHNLRMFATWTGIKGTDNGLFLQDALEGMVQLQVGRVTSSEGSSIATGGSVLDRRLSSYPTHAWFDGLKAYKLDINIQ